MAIVHPPLPLYTLVIEEMVSVDLQQTVYEARIHYGGDEPIILPGRPSYGAAERLAWVRIAAMEVARKDDEARQPCKQRAS